MNPRLWQTLTRGKTTHRPTVWQRMQLRRLLERLRARQE